MDDFDRTWSREIPVSLDWLGSDAPSRTWRADLPDVVEAAAERWDLQIGRTLPGGMVSLVLSATDSAKQPVVVKIPWPHRESEHEATALGRWHGDGAVRILDHDERSGAMLLERCIPGTALSGVAHDEAITVLADLLRRLWVPAGEPFRTLAEEACHWADGIPGTWERAGRPFERRIVDATVETLRSLSKSQGEAVLLHQDLHPGNVLRSEREPWLVIDPKPLVGEREFALAPIVRASELGHERRLVVRRLDWLCDELNLDRDRAKAWAFAQTVAWGFDGGKVMPNVIETARWLLDAR